MRRSIARISVAVLTIVAAAWVVYRFGRPVWVPIVQRWSGGKTVGQAIDGINRKKGDRITALFGEMGYPPRENDCGMNHTTVILSPVDFRTSAEAPPGDRPAWCRELYRKLRQKVMELPPG